MKRHLALVYSAAYRRCGGRAHLAEEVSQSVFCDLARKAPALERHGCLEGWLHRSTRYRAIDALRAEVRRGRLTEALSNMNDPKAEAEDQADWEQLRPLLDEALDQLREGDRTLVLRRYFEGQSYSQLGETLSVGENTARMRCERALERLRRLLARRGIRSSAAALGIVLGAQASVSAPAGLSATVTQAALGVAPQGLAATLGTLFIMSKVTAPIVSAVLVAGLGTAAWTLVTSDSRAEIARLRLENDRLASVVNPGASDGELARVAGPLGERTLGVVRLMKRRQEAKATAGGADSSGGDQRAAGARGAEEPGFRNQGQATPYDAWMSFAWAEDGSRYEELGRLIYLGAAERARALEILGGMPEAVRGRFTSPEEFYAFLLAADALIAPPPGADVLSKYVPIELAPGRIRMGRTPESKRGHEFQQTAEGWKYVLPMAGVEAMPNVLGNEVLSRMAGGEGRP